VRYLRREGKGTTLERRATDATRTHTRVSELLKADQTAEGSRLTEGRKREENQGNAQNKLAAVVLAPGGGLNDTKDPPNEKRASPEPKYPIHL
jgi:hypothetical protein